jgi:hypothetical protein
MISEFFRFYASQFRLIDVPHTRKVGEEVYRVNWTEVAPADVKGDYLAIFAGFAYPINQHGAEINLIYLKEAYDLIGNGECVRIILEPGKISFFATLVEGREKTMALLKLKG